MLITESTTAGKIASRTSRAIWSAVAAAPRAGWEGGRRAGRGGGDLLLAVAQARAVVSQMRHRPSDLRPAGRPDIDRARGPGPAERRAIGLLLPCNVVVRSNGPDVTLVQALDPQVMVQLSGAPELREVTDEAIRRLRAALDALSG